MILLCVCVCRDSTLPESSASRFIDIEAEDSSDGDSDSPSRSSFVLDKQFDHNKFVDFVEKKLKPYIKKKYNTPVTFVETKPFSDTSILVFLPEDTYSEATRKDHPVIHDACNKLGGTNYLLSVWKWIKEKKKNKEGATVEVEYWRKFKGSCWLGLWVEPTVGTNVGNYFTICVELESLPVKDNKIVRESNEEKEFLCVTKYPITKDPGFDGKK